MKKESTYYFLLVSFLVALLTTNAYSLQFDSILDRNLQKELVDEGGSDSQVLTVFELEHQESSFHFLALSDFNTFFQRDIWSSDESLSNNQNSDSFNNVRKRNLLTLYYSSFLSDRVKHV